MPSGGEWSRTGLMIPWRHGSRLPDALLPQGWCSYPQGPRRRSTSTFPAAGRGKTTPFKFTSQKLHTSLLLSFQCQQRSHMPTLGCTGNWETHPYSGWPRNLLKNWKFCDHGRRGENWYWGKGNQLALHNDDRVILDYPLFDMAPHWFGTPVASWFPFWKWTSLPW